MKCFKQQCVTKIEMYAFLTHVFHCVYSLNVSAYLIFVFYLFLHAVSHLNFGGRAVEVDAALGHVAQTCSVLERYEHVLSACK